MTYRSDTSSWLFLTVADAAGIIGYKRLDAPPVPMGVEATYTGAGAVGAGEVLIKTWVSDALGLTSLDAGIWTFTLYASVDTATDLTQIVIRVYKRTSAGVETELFNVTSAEINDAVAALQTVTYSFEGANIAITDRLVIKFFHKTDGVTSHITMLYLEGAVNQSRVNVSFPVRVGDGDMAKALYDPTGAGVFGGGASALDDLTDVTITTPANGEVLIYDGSEWVNDIIHEATPGGIAIGAKVYNSAEITILNESNPSTILTFDTVVVDSGGFYDGAHPERLTIPADGWYALFGAFMYYANATGQREIFFKMNAAQTTIAVTLVDATANSLRTRMAIAAAHYFAAGNYITMGAWQNSGGDLNIYGNSIQSPSFSVVAISAPPFALDADTGALFGFTGNELTLDTQAANLVWAGPASGADAKPTFRALVAEDIAGLVTTEAAAGEILIQDGSSAPPVMLTNEAQDDFLYEG